MTDRPILFNAPMVRALLAGAKTQTRRIVKPQPPVVTDHQSVATPDAFVCPEKHTWWSGNYTQVIYHAARCPYGQPGDRLWVKEKTHRRPMLNFLTGEPLDEKYDGGAYSADYADMLTPEEFDIAWWYSRSTCPSIHMPRVFSRITLEITEVRIERLQDISRGDAMEEGCPFPNMAAGPDPRQWYAELWDSINGPGSWEVNPWVWVVAFKRVEGGQHG